MVAIQHIQFFPQLTLLAPGRHCGTEAVIKMLKLMNNLVNLVNLVINLINSVVKTALTAETWPGFPQHLR